MQKVLRAVAVAGLVFSGAQASAQIHAKGAPAALGAANATASVSLDNAISAACFIAAGTLTGTVVPEISIDGGTTWIASYFEKPDTGQVVPSVALTNPNAATSLIVYGAPGATDLRVRVSAYTTGTATATLRATQVAAPRMMFSVNASNLTAAFNNGQIVEKGPRWTGLHTPAVSLKATASKAAGAAGVRHAADCISFSGGATTAPIATELTVDLRDGATGAGAIIWQARVVVPASAGYTIPVFERCGLNLVGSAATAMTLEWSALLTNLFQNVALSGYDVQ
jgi:hypothetical protein